MEQKFIQVNITVLLYLIIFYYLKNAAISFVEFPKKLFDCVKAYYVFLIFLTILGFFKRLFMLIRITVSHWIREMLSVLFLGNGGIDVNKKENAFWKKKSKRLAYWKMLQVADFKDRQHSNADVEYNVTKEIMKQLEQKNEKNKDNKMKYVIHKSEKACFGSPDVYFLKKKQNKLQKEEIVMQIGEMRRDKNIEGIYKVKESMERKAEDKKEENEKKENKEKQFYEKYNLKKNNAKTIFKEVEEGSFADCLEDEKLCLREDQVESAFINSEKNIKYMFIDNKIPDTSVLNYFEKKIKHKSKCMETYMNSFHPNENIYVNGSVDISNEIKGYVMTNMNTLTEENLLYEEIRKDLANAKNAHIDIKHMTEQTINEKDTSALCNIKVKNEENIKDDKVKNLTKSLKPILKKHALQYSNLVKSGGDKEKKKMKGVRFNKEVETYFFEKNSFEECPFTSESRHMLWNLYESYKLTSSDFFDYFNIKINFKFAISDILNPLHDYKNKIVNRF